MFVGVFALVGLWGCLWILAVTVAFLWVCLLGVCLFVKLGMFAGDWLLVVLCMFVVSFNSWVMVGFVFWFAWELVWVFVCLL